MNLGAVILFSATPFLAIEVAHPSAAPSKAYTVDCTFSNPAYSGLCVVSEEVSDVAPEAACQRILSCLNNPRCAAKTYCNATTIRGGWKLESAKREAVQ